MIKPSGKEQLESRDVAMFSTSAKIISLFLVVFNITILVYCEKFSNNLHGNLSVSTKLSSQITCNEVVCGREAPGMNVKYLGCNKKCSPDFGGGIKSCWKGYCTPCSRIAEHCDGDNPGSCCQFESTILNIRVKSTSCPETGICPSPCIDAGNKCDPKMAFPCCSGMCLLLEPPDIYTCQAGAVEPSCKVNKGTYNCNKYKAVAQSFYGYCKCPTKLDGQDVAQCRSGKCTMCINKGDKCDINGPADQCCHFNRNGKSGESGGCVKGICGPCHATGRTYYVGDGAFCKGAPCCDAKAKCERSGTSLLSVCKL